MSKCSGEGFIYIYKCTIARGFCKIGCTWNIKKRMKDHVNTPYHGFAPYINFEDEKTPVYTAFKVKDKDDSDRIVKDYFSGYQIGKLEVYNIDYKIAIQELYNLLKEKDQFIELIEDKITNYNFLKLNDEVTIDTSGQVFESVRDKLLSKYNGKLPEEVLQLLREEEEFKDHCYSHYSSGNFVRFPNGLVLDIHCGKSGRALILNKLQDALIKK